jgi:hypothetical protein
MKKIYLFLLLFPFAAVAQKVSLGLRIGPAFFSPMNTLPMISLGDKITPSTYSALDIGVTMGKDWEGSLTLAGNAVQTKYRLNTNLIVLYAKDMNQVVLRFNRFVNPGKTRMYIGFNSGFCFYKNPDSALLYRLSPEKYAITDKGSGFMAGLQTGIKTAVSGRLDFSADVAVQYFGIGASKRFYDGWASLNYNYFMYPVTVGLHYKFGVSNDNNKRDRVQRPVKKRKSFGDEEWK